MKRRDRFKLRQVPRVLRVQWWIERLLQSLLTGADSIPSAVLLRVTTSFSSDVAFRLAWGIPVVMLLELYLDALPDQSFS